MKQYAPEKKDITTRHEFMAKDLATKKIKSSTKPDALAAELQKLKLEEEKLEAEIKEILGQPIDPQNTMKKRESKMMKYRIANNVLSGATIHRENQDLHKMIQHLKLMRQHA